MGWVEPVVLLPWGIEVKAKLDTGAKTSSLHAKNIQRFDKEGEEWVRFELDLGGPPKQESKVEVERPLYRDVRIKRHTTASHQRPVVKLDVCINGKSEKAQFSLINRRGFNYPVLLGRSFLKDVAVIDPAATFLTKNRNNTCTRKDTILWKWHKKKKPASSTAKEAPDKGNQS